MSAQTIPMPSKKRPVSSVPNESKKSPEQYRKPSRMVRIREVLAVQGEILAKRLAKDLTEVCNDALREMLEKNNLWPVPDAK